MPRYLNCALIVAAMCVAIAGCATPVRESVATYISPTLLNEHPARIVVIPFNDPKNAPQGSQLVTEAMVLALQDAFRSDVLVSSSKDDRLMAESALWQRGRVDVDCLVAARNAYLADAFLFGALTQYKPYDPPLVGLKLRMLSATTGEVLWAAEGVFDARERDVRDEAVRFYKSSGMSGRLYGPELMFMSPKQYSTFVAYETVEPLKNKFAEYARLQAAGKPAMAAKPATAGKPNN